MDGMGAGMRNSETVTFGGLGGLERAAELRGDQARQAAMWADGAARVVPMWRGKPMVAGEARDRLALLAPTHPVFADMSGRPLFLGLVKGAPVFAADLSSWEPVGIDAAAQGGGFFDTTEQQHPDTPPDHLFVELRGVMTLLSPLDAELAATARGLFEWHRTHGFCARCGHASDVTMAGWQRQCPACNAPHFPRTDPVVIMLVTHGNRVLLGRSHGWPQGMYSLLAGFIEPGETVEAAVRREVAEETGVKVGAVRYQASQPWPFPASLMLGFSAEATSETITLDPAEIEDAMWMSREDMADALAGRHPLVKPARKGAIAQFLLNAWVADLLD